MKAVVCLLVLACAVNASKAEGGCVYNGIFHPVGETFIPDPCTTCTCVANGNVDCIAKVCPQLLNCPKTDTPIGQCCPICSDKATVPPTSPRAT